MMEFNVKERIGILLVGIILCGKCSFGESRAISWSNSNVRMDYVSQKLCMSNIVYACSTYTKF